MTKFYKQKYFCYNQNNEPEIAKPRNVTRDYILFGRTQIEI